MSIIDRVAHYLEYPDLNHPQNVLVDLIKDMGIEDKIGADSDGYPWIFGYRGEPLSQLTDAQVINCRAPIEDQMMVKSQAEIALLRKRAANGAIWRICCCRSTPKWASAKSRYRSEPATKRP